MLLEKIYQPDISIYQEGVLGPMFMVEVVEDSLMDEEAETRLKQVMGQQVCYHGALVNQGRMRVLDIFPNGVGSHYVTIAAEIDLSDELRRFAGYSGELWTSEKNFFVWMQTYAQNETAMYLKTEDQEALRAEVLPWIKGSIIEFTSLRGNPIGQAF